MIVATAQAETRRRDNMKSVKLIGLAVAIATLVACGGGGSGLSTAWAWASSASTVVVAQGSSQVVTINPNNSAISDVSVFAAVMPHSGISMTYLSPKKFVVAVNSTVPPGVYTINPTLDAVPASLNLPSAQANITVQVMAPSAAFTISDSAFVSTEWQNTSLIKTSGSAGSTTLNSGINPPARQFRFNVLDTVLAKGWVFDTYLPIAFDLSAASGLTSVSAQVDMQQVNGPDLMAGSLGLKQGTKFYIANTSQTFTTTVTTRTWSALSASQFNEWDPLTGAIFASSHPDFSATGQDLYAGFWVASNGLNASLIDEVLVDNLSVTFTP